MAYNPYQFYPQQPTMFQQQNYQNQNTNNLIWVQGEAGAKSYLVAPNTTVALWDSEDKIIYLKSSDASGMPSIKTLDYSIREYGAAPSKFAPNSDFVTKEDISIIESRLNDLEGKFEGLSKTTSKKKGEKNE